MTPADVGVEKNTRSVAGNNASARIKKMELTAKKFAANRDGKVLIDIRRVDEWRLTGVIDGAHLLTFFDAEGNADVAGWMVALEKIATPETTLVLICRSGHRTRIVLDFLLTQTPYRQVQHLKNGMTDWLANHLPVVAMKD